MSKKLAGAQLYSSPNFFTTSIVAIARPAPVLIEVADDGRGFDVEKVSAGRGLGSLRQRAVDLGGSLDITSKPGAGTRVRLQLPVLEDEG